MQKLLKQAIKIVEKVPEKRMQEVVNLNSMQFRFKPGRKIIEAV